MHGPSPDTMYPMEGFPQICFLKNAITRPNIDVGDFTYYDDPDGVDNFEKNVLYHFPFIGDRLRIGKFCAIARGVKFIMNGANHQMGGISTYPFFIFGNGWEVARPASDELPYKGDTVIGNDVSDWLRCPDHARRDDRRRRDHCSALRGHCRCRPVHDRRGQSCADGATTIRRRERTATASNRLVGSSDGLDQPASWPDSRGRRRCARARGTFDSLR